MILPLHRLPRLFTATACPAPARLPRAAARAFAALAGACLALAPAARADDGGGVQLRESDYAAYAALRLANAVAEEKRMFAHDRAKQAAIDSAFAQACSAAGWTKERFEEVDNAVSSALGAIDDPENASDEVTPATLATVKAHLAELRDSDGLRKRAHDLVQAEAQAAKRGAPPTAAQLAGRWVWDLDLTVESMAGGLGDEIKQTMREQLAKTLVGATYTFGPGDRLVATNQRPGVAPETQEGRYRLEGSKLVIIARMGSRDREDKVDVGLKDGHLLVGMMGMYTVFRRE